MHVLTFKGASARARNIGVFLTVLLLLSGDSAFGWGREGHHIVALLAQGRLTKQTRQAILDLLGPNDTLVSVSTWPDEIRKDHPETAGWHYVSIPRTAPFFDEARDCYQPDPAQNSSETDHQNCVVDRIDSFTRILGDFKQPKEVRVEALKYLVHLVGDVHQPMHAMGEEHGGNEIKISQFGSSTCGTQGHLCNLHSLWDSGMIDHTHLDENAYQEVLAIKIAKDHVDATPEGTPADWANESHRLAEGALLANGDAADELYFQHEIGILDLRLELAGLRLAKMLNHSLGGDESDSY